MIDPAQAAQVREDVRQAWKDTLALLTAELAELAAAEEPVPKDLVERLKVCSDQLRRDHPIDPHAAPAQPPAEPEDPLAGLVLIDPEDDDDAA